MHSGSWQVIPPELFMSTSTPSFQSSPPRFVGFDVGGTAIKFGIVDDRGDVILRHQFPTEQERGAADAIDRMRACFHEGLNEVGLEPGDVAAIGLGTPGPLDLESGRILNPSNLPAWLEFPIRQRLVEACDGIPVTYSNDANAAAYGEYWVGCGREFDSLIMLTLGTGVGGGIIIGGLSVEGHHSLGSECGHVVIDSADNARLCSCGQSGHLEAYASATAVIRRMESLLASGQATSIRDRMAEGRLLDGLLVAEEAENGDATARQVVMETAEFLGRGIASLAHTIDPEAVVLGGAMNFGGADSPLGREFLARIRSRVAEMTFPAIGEKLRIVFSQLGGDAGFIGAAGLARRAFHASGSKASSPS